MKMKKLLEDASLTHGLLSRKEATLHVVMSVYLSVSLSVSACLPFFLPLYLSICLSAFVCLCVSPWKCGSITLSPLGPSQIL